MKKAKIFLSAIAVFAVVGGAVAFKANKSGTTTWYTYKTDAAHPSGFCTTTVNALTIDSDGSLGSTFTGTISPNQVPLPAQCLVTTIVYPKD